MADRLDDVVMKSVNEVVAETFESLHGRMTMLEAKMQHQWEDVRKGMGRENSCSWNQVAECRIRTSVQADLEKLWTKRMEKEDKIMLNKYETLNSTVERLGGEIIYLRKRKENGQRGKHRGRLV